MTDELAAPRGGQRSSSFNLHGGSNVAPSVPATQGSVPAEDRR